MNVITVTGIFALFCWAVFGYFFHKDRSRYRNCYILFFALLSTLPFILSVCRYNGIRIEVFLAQTVFLALLIVPFFLIHNGIVMMRKEGRQFAHVLSLALGIIVLIGELATFALVLAYSFSSTGEGLDQMFHSVPFIIGTLISISVIYGSMAFVIFMIYTLFLQFIPRKKDFDYVIIHGAGLLQGSQISKLLKDRLDKAIEVYRKDPTPPVLIPSGGKGDDETRSEAAAMADYLLSQGIPEEKILIEDRSTTTLENLKFSKEIIDAQPGNKYTALVTSNYHVYRALRYCHKIGLNCTGIGSHVAFYYWPSALIREFVAIHAELKHTLIFFGGWLIFAGMVLGVLIR